MEQVQRSQQLAQKAKHLLQTKHIEEVLSAYGKVVYTGSYAADLMVWPDLDIQLVLPENVNKLETILNICKVFLEDSDLKDIKLINFEKRKKAGMPVGMYMGMHINDKSDNLVWKIDIWALETEHYLRDVEFHRQIMSKLTPELKSLLIYWKYKLMGENDRVPHLGSYYLYKAVLFNNITSDEQIAKYLKESGVKF